MSLQTLTTLLTVSGTCIMNREQVFQGPEKHKVLFQGRCGQWTGDNASIKLKQDAVPFYGKAYPIPLKQLEVTKNEVYPI